MSPKQKFSEGERVLCFHGPLIYEAKALKSTITKDKQIKYYIHYAGWNKNWDEWVPENRVLKYNDINVQKQKEVFKQHSSAAGRTKKATSKGKKNDSSSISKEGAVSGSSESRASTPSKELNSSLAAPSTSGRSRTKSSTNANSVSGAASNASISTTTSAAPTTSSSGDTPATTTATTTITSTTATTDTKDGETFKKKRNRIDLSVETEEQFLSKVEVKIKIPDELKPCLVDDWDAVTRQHKLIDIPAKITVQDIIDNYLASKKSSKSTNASKEVAITDVANGLIEYFNVMLGSQLLYKFERPQYAEILQQHPDVPCSKLYGAFHFLRLFVKLGSMLGFTALDDKALQTLLAHLNDFLKFLVKNSATYFNMTNFVNVSPEYHRNTQ